VKRLILWVGIAFVLAILIILIFVGLRNCSHRTSRSASIAALIKSAEELETKADLQGARAIYQKLMVDSPNSPQVSAWQKKAEELNIKLLFSPIITKGSLRYEIKPNDTLLKIAKEFNTTVELIKKMNNLNTDKIFPGQKIKVYNQPFGIVVDKSENTLILKSNEEIIKIYTVATGANNSTPVGNYKIVTKLTNPTWFKTGAVVPPGSPENILGTRWLGLNLTGYGIHGTNDPQTLGRQITQGCVRMANQDVEELYAIVPEGAEVSIID
jgi:lipoprotein-anchoring transpeptidase ErfK/SrfK